MTQPVVVVTKLSANMTKTATFLVMLLVNMVQTRLAYERLYLHNLLKNSSK